MGGRFGLVVGVVCERVVCVWGGRVLGWSKKGALFALVWVLWWHEWRRQGDESEWCGVDVEAGGTIGL